VETKGRNIVIGLLAAAAGAAVAVAATALPGVAADKTPVGTTDRAAIETIVRNYILDHPEILPEAMERLQGRETAKAIAANKALIETPYAGAWEGAADADVVLVEFFDYACGYCRGSVADVTKLLKSDPKLKIVYREMPVLGPDSEVAAHVSLAVARSGRYGEFHRALFAAGRPDAATVTRLARNFGIDAAKSKTTQTTEEIATNQQLQGALRLTGTPSWVVGNRLLGGAVGYGALKAAIAEARAAKSGTR